MLKKTICLQILITMFICAGCSNQIGLDDFAKANHYNENDANMFYEENSEPLDESKVTYYYYDRLMGTEKELYCILYNELMSLKEQIYVPSYVDFDIINRIFKYVMFDHPEIYWIDGYEIVEIHSEIQLYPYYCIDPKDINHLNMQCDRFMGDIYEYVGERKTDYEISKIVYDYIVENVIYAPDANDQNMLSAMLNKRSVCTGFTKLYQYILNQFGIESAAVTGLTKRGVSHMWNIVKIDGQYYYTDLTYGTINSSGKIINYDYFNVTTEQIENIYEFEAGQILPLCIDNTANYYVHNGYVFSYFDKKMIERLFASGLPVVMKCDNKECYVQIIDYLITEKNIYEYVPRQSISYRTSDELLKIEFY